MHNYKEINRSHIDTQIYSNVIALAPIFLENDVDKLRSFVKRYVKRKCDVDLLMRIDHGKLKPAKALQDALTSMIKGNREFLLVDEQKIAYETVSKLVANSVRDANSPLKGMQKHIVIVSGGPGTGKSVVAIQLLCDLIQKGYSAAYVTKNAAPRNVYFEKLRQEKYKLTYIKSLFKSSDAFWNAPANCLDCIIVDEAHRLKKKSAIPAELLFSLLMRIRKLQRKTSVQKTKSENGRHIIALRYMKATNLILFRNSGVMEAMGI